MAKIKDYAEKFYKSKEWQRCRLAFIASLPDKTCPRCKERKGKIVHHKIEITPENISDPFITLNFKNLEYICQQCHTEEHLRKSATRSDVEFDENGNLVKRKIRQENILLPKIIMPRNKIIYIVCGAPGSGKSTYVKKVANLDDLVIDLDNILLEFTKGKIYDSAERYLERAIKKRNQYLNTLNKTENKVVWFIVSAPKADERKHWKEQLGGITLLIDTSKKDCFERLKKDSRRKNNIEKYLIATERWFSNFTEGYIDKRIPPTLV